jgi:hypothetical protein
VSTRMRARSPFVVICLAAGLLAAAASARADGLKVERTGAFAGTASDAVKAALDTQGYRATLSDGTVDVWFRKDFPGLKAGGFVGVVTFPAARGDFRGQTIKAGTYTLRYAKIPADGNHLGAAPTADFLLMLRTSDDADPAVDLPWEKMTELSKNVAVTNHPSPLNLADVSSQKDFPAVATNSMGHEVLYVKLKTAGGEQPVGVVLKGRTEHE